MADETIIYQYVVEAGKAIEDAEKIRAQIEAVKTTMRDLSAQSKQSFKDLGQGLVEVFKKLKNDEGGREKISDLLKIDPETIRSAKAFATARQEAINRVRVATQELNQEERTQTAAMSKAVQQARMVEASAMREYERVTKQGYGVMSQAAQAYGAQVASVKQQIVTQSQASGQTYQQVAAQMQQAGTATNVLNSALKQLNTTTNQTQQGMGGLAGAVQYAFVTVLGMNAVNAIRQAIASLGELMEKGQEVAQSFFMLETGTRALRRAGVDVTSQELLDNLQRLNNETGKFFTQLELVKGSATFANLIRDMGFAREEIFDLQEAIITLAIVNGRSMDEVQKTVALALSSGYTEGLQRLGLSINRVNIALRANEMGFEGGYTALTEHQRAMATLSLIMEKTANYGDDLTEAQYRLFGSVEQTKTAIEDTKNAIGEQLLPVWLIFLKMVQGLIFLLSKIPLFHAIQSLTGLAQAIMVLPKVWEAASKSTDNFIERLQRVAAYILRVGEAISKLKPLNEVFNEFLDFGQDEIPLGTPKIDAKEVETAGENLKEYVQDLYADIQRETEEFNNDMAKLQRDLVRDLAEIDRDLASDLAGIDRDVAADLAKIDRDVANDLEEIERDLASDLAKIDRELARDLAEDRRKLAADLAEIDQDLARDLEDLARDRDRDLTEIGEKGSQKELDARRDYDQKLLDEDQKYTDKVEDTNEKFRERDLQAEIGYQEKLRKLRDEFLFDLEDALRERDARQILKLSKRYRYDQSEAGREFEMERAERERQKALELADLARERDQRKAEAAQDLAEKIAQIRYETEQQIAERQLQYQRDREDRIRDAAQRKAERLADFEAQKQERALRAAEEKAERQMQAEEQRQERLLRAEEEKRERLIRAEEEKAERKRKAEEEKAERLIQQQERIAELKIEFNERLQALVNALANEKDMTAAMLKQIGDEYRRTYGPNGVIDRQISYHIARLAQLALMRYRAAGATSFSMNENVAGSLTTQTSNTGGGGQPGKVFAEGGIYYADRPTTVTFGEKGLERAEFTPVNYTGRNTGRVTHSDVALPNREGRIALRVLLSPEIIAEIQENTLDRAANILFEVQRQR